PLASFVDDYVVAEEAPVVVPAPEAAIYEDNVARTVLEDEIVPATETPAAVASVITEATTPLASFVDDFVVAEEAPVVVPAPEAAIYEDNVARTVLEDEIVPATETPAAVASVITEATTPLASFVDHYVVEEEKPADKPVSRAAVYEDNVSDIKLEDSDARRTVVEDERDDDRVVKRVSTTIVEENNIIKVVEEHYEYAETAEPEVKEEEETKKRTKISTIPTTKGGKVKHEDPMIPTLPPVSAQGVGSNTDMPFVLPANKEAQDVMAKYTDLNKKEEETSFESALSKAENIPVAPMIDREIENEEPSSEPAPEQEEVVVADSEVEINFESEPEEEPTIPTELPELIEEPEEIEEVEEIEEPEEVEEEIVEEPAPVEPEEPEVPVVPAAEPEEEPAPEEEPEIVPVFTDAEHADELMTDEEAEEHIEIIEEAPGEERTGKMNFINLDTICENFEDGETVTLEALKEKKLIRQNTGRVKILARGTMTKNLEIIADSFSLQAVKMITLAGGRSEQYK
ncbi:MAG: uL15 family ribosomal protein, partial [Clostridia bacterium]|nr:uL15 family ribosomal protein [Clostridia bacterium]